MCLEEANILELISQFEAHFVCQHTDFDTKTCSFEPLIVTAVMTVFGEFIEGASESGTEAVIEKKLEDMHTDQSTTTSQKKSKYSGFWQQPSKDRGTKSGMPGLSPLGHEYMGEKKVLKKSKVDRCDSDSPGDQEACNFFDNVLLQKEEQNKSFDNEQQSESEQIIGKRVRDIKLHAW